VLWTQLDPIHAKGSSAATPKSLSVSSDLTGD
jgi:hypothetical protein